MFGHSTYLISVQMMIWLVILQLGGGFNYFFFMLITTWGDDPICLLFFRWVTWVVQPPTNSNILFFLMSPPWDDFPNSNHFSLHKPLMICHMIFVCTCNICVYLLILFDIYHGSPKTIKKVGNFLHPKFGTIDQFFCMHIFM